MATQITRRGFLGALAALPVSCLMVGLVGCGSTSHTATGVNNNKTLTVGVRSDIVGFGYLNPDTGNYYGLEIDLAEELAARLDYGNVDFVTVTPDTRKDMLLAGEIDCIIACYSIAETRLANFDFSEPYYSDASIIIVENSSLITELDQLEGLTFGTMQGANTASQLAIRLAEEGFSSGERLWGTDDNTDVQFDTYHLLQYPSYDELIIALEKGEVDAACMDGSIAKAYMTSDRSQLDFVIDMQEYGVATQKDSELSAEVDAAIKEMLDDGTIDALIDKWD